MAESFNPARIPAMWVNQVLNREHDDVRFEAFANEVATVLEGAPVVGTSKSWDLGRDGRALGERQGTFVLTTLRTDSDKAKEDATRLKSKARKIRHVYYVAPRVTSEAVLEAHCEDIRAIVGEDVVVDPLGGPQLEDLVAGGKAAEAFRQHYAGPETEALSLQVSLVAGARNPLNLEFSWTVA